MGRCVAAGREDMTHWILSLKENGDGDLPHKTSFTTEFSKCRNCVEAHARPQIWTLDTRTTPLPLTWGSYETIDILLDNIRNGVSRASDLAELMGVSKGAISKWAAKLERLGRIRIQNREYISVH
jgi:hypothetical protein